MARNRHPSSRNRRSSKNFVKKTVENSVSLVKSTSRKYMPKVKTGLENVGSKVVTTTEKSVPFLQQMTRKFFGMFGSKTKKHRKH
jgi:hypothetical protein